MTTIASAQRPAISIVTEAMDPDLGSAIRAARRRLLPFLILMYVLAFIDRSNVGFAKDALRVDRHISDAGFALGAGLFFIGYGLFGVPSNLALRRFGARRWMSLLMVAWGVFAAGLAETRSAETFYGLRFLLGVAEAGFFPGIIYYLTLWFPARERAQTTGTFYFGLPLALMIGGPFSGWLLDAPGVLGFHTWRLMFVVEGLVASAVGVVAFFYLTDSPRHAAWLSDDQRRALANVLDAEEAARPSRASRSFAEVFVDRRLLLLCLAYFGIQVSIYGVVFYLPSRLASLVAGHVGLLVGMLSAIPWLVAMCALVVVSRMAHRATSPGRWAASLLMMAAIAIAISTACQSITPALIAFSVAAVGVVAAQPLFWTLPTAYLGGTAAVAGIGLVTGLGNLGGFVAPVLQSAASRAAGWEQAGLLSLSAIGALAAILLWRLGGRSSPTIGTLSAADPR